MGSTKRTFEKERAAKDQQNWLDLMEAKKEIQKLNEKLKQHERNNKSK